MQPNKSASDYMTLSESAIIEFKLILVWEFVSKRLQNRTDYEFDETKPKSYRFTMCFPLLYKTYPRLQMRNFLRFLKLSKRVYMLP